MIEHVLVIPVYFVLLSVSICIGQFWLVNNEKNFTNSNFKINLTGKKRNEMCANYYSFFFLATHAHFCILMVEWLNAQKSQSSHNSFVKYFSPYLQNELLHFILVILWTLPPTIQYFYIMSRLLLVVHHRIIPYNRKQNIHSNEEP